MKVKHVFFTSVVTGKSPKGVDIKTRKPNVSEVEVPDGSRFYHVRAPLMIRQFIGHKEVTPAVVPDLASQNGGCTVLVSPHDDEYVAVRVGWVRYSDAYNRSLGRFTAASKEPTLISKKELEAELEAIEEQMLLSCAYPLRRDEELLKQCLGDWSRAAARFYHPEEKNVQS